MASSCRYSVQWIPLAVLLHHAEVAELADAQDLGFKIKISASPLLCAEVEYFKAVATKSLFSRMRSGEVF